LKNKNLVVLRSCNELLRRLSRAEDAVFCGRVFIFLFQSFPLGDRSSVNLRGEFHIENATTFEEPSPAVAQIYEDGMEVDKEGSTSINDSNPSLVKTYVDSATKATENAILDVDALYPVFWKLQQAFSNPTRLFTLTFFEEFKKGLEATVTKFRNVPKILEPRPAAELKRGIKRKRDEQAEDFASNFNPKYLTSRDLFKLEVRYPVERP
jgi:THO complex subunit 1